MKLALIMAFALGGCATQQTSPPHWGPPASVNVCTFPCWLGYTLLLSPGAFDGEPKSPQRIAQGIARTMEDCLCFGYGQQGGALECTCRAERACVAAGLSARCAMDDQVMETRCYHPPIVGSCE